MTKKMSKENFRKKCIYNNLTKKALNNKIQYNLT